MPRFLVAVAGGFWLCAVAASPSAAFVVVPSSPPPPPPAAAVAVAVEQANPAFIGVGSALLRDELGAAATATAPSSAVADGRTLLSLATAASGASSSPSSAISSSFAIAAADDDQAKSVAPPSKSDVQLLRQAFAEFYGTSRDLDKSEELLTAAIERWKGQPDDEVAGLLRVRGDCYMLLSMPKEAYGDYDKAAALLKGPGGKGADPAELPAALLGRARAVKSQPPASVDASLVRQAADDYREALILTSREEWDTDDEMVEDGARRNPYATWEWGSALRLKGDWKAAAAAHQLAADAFDEIGDRARSVISLIDSGIDYAAADDADSAVAVLEAAIPKTKGVESRDVELLRRVLAKEGEGRIALAATLWDKPGQQRVDAEAQLGDACIRLDQMQVDAAQKSKGSGGSSQQQKAGDGPTSTVSPLAFSIDDDEAGIAKEISCYKFRDAKFLSKLGWPDSLQRKVDRLEKLR